MSVILLILKILGIIILSILSIIVLLILIPFFYRIHVKYTKEDQDYSFKLNTLLRFLYVIGDYSDDLNLCVRVLGIPVYRQGKYSKKNSRSQMDDSGEDLQTADLEEDCLEDLQTEDFKEDCFEESEVSNSEILDSETEDNSEDTSSKRKKGKIKKPKVPKEKVSIKERIAKIKSKINKNNVEAIKHIARCIGRFIKRIKPHIVDADCDYSLGSPDTTGMSFGAINVLPSAHKDKVKIRPDFESEETYFYGEISLKGNFQILNIISLLFRILINKNCRLLIFGGK